MALARPVPLILARPAAEELHAAVALKFCVLLSV